VRLNTDYSLSVKVKTETPT